MLWIILVLYLICSYFFQLTGTVTLACYAQSVCSSINFTIDAITSSCYCDRKRACSKIHDVPRLHVSSVSTKFAQYLFFKWPVKWILFPVLLMMDPVNTGRVLLLPPLFFPWLPLPLELLLPLLPLVLPLPLLLFLFFLSWFLLFPEEPFTLSKLLFLSPLSPFSILIASSFTKFGHIF